MLFGEGKIHVRGIDWSWRASHSVRAVAAAVGPAQAQYAALILNMYCTSPTKEH